ncbi:MAG: alpha/beta hydrolase [bacterium]
MKTEQGSFTGARGVEIFWQAWIPDTIRAVCMIAHGLGEHSARYEHVAAALVERDLACFALDHRGHGRSGGKRGHVLSFEEYENDLEILHRQVRERFQDMPVFLVGHSMGGLISAGYAITKGHGLAGLILSSAALRVDVDEPAIKLALGRLFSKVFPFVTMSNGLDPEFISHDPDVVQNYKNDPLVHDRVSARWFTEFLNAIDRVQQNAHQITVPVLVMQSGDDNMVNPAGAREFHDRLTTEDSALQYWDGFYHEMFNETQKQKPISFMIEWIEKRLP